MTWFSWVAWSVRAHLLCSVKLDAQRLLVNVHPVLDSTSVLCSCNLTPSCQELEELSTSFFWWRPLVQVETSSFR